MDKNLIQQKILEVFRHCGVQTFPVDCFQILERYRIRLFSYQELRETNPILYREILRFTEDACRYGNSIYYNEAGCFGRVRFSLMHELGHILLGHDRETPEFEAEANYFASHLLAPRMAVHYARCQTAASVARLFLITREASGYVLEDCRQWERRVHFRMNSVDRAFYLHFYNEHHGGFVFSHERCRCCNADIYNKPRVCLCSGCWELMAPLDSLAQEDPLSPETRIMGYFRSHC